MHSFIHGIPKAELHIHIEGSLEPDLMLEIARKNGIDLPFKDIADIRRAYEFKDLQSFLDIYYQGARVLCDEADFYRMTRAYFEKAAEQNVRHAEIFFDPQTHTARGIEFETVIDGIYRGIKDAEERLGVSACLIMCILRDLSVEEGMKTLETALGYKDRIMAVGLDSSEVGFPPKRFKPVFDRARRNGLKTVAHAGEEGPPDYIWQALTDLRVERIDHGVRCVEDPGLVEYLYKTQTPLTVCPLSNIKLNVFDAMKHHPVRRLIETGLCITINSDDPAYFGGYIEENFRVVQKAFGLDDQDIYSLCRNAFTASFLNDADKNRYLAELDAYMANAGGVSGNAD